MISQPLHLALGHLCRNYFLSILFFSFLYKEKYIYIEWPYKISFITNQQHLYDNHWLMSIIKHQQPISLLLIGSPLLTVDQKRSVTFIEAQPEPTAAPTDILPATGQPQGCSPGPSRKPEGTDKPVLTSSPAIVVADLHSVSPKQVRALQRQQGLHLACLFAGTTQM